MVQGNTGPCHKDTLALVITHRLKGGTLAHVTGVQPRHRGTSDHVVSSELVQVTDGIRSHVTELGPVPRGTLVHITELDPPRGTLVHVTELDPSPGVHWSTSRVYAGPRHGGTLVHVTGVR